MYEIEHRALLTKDTYDQLVERLTREAISLGKDDKEVAYYIFSDKLLKVVRNISKNTGTLSLKLNALGKGSSFQELEVSFDASGTDTMRAIIDNIGTPEQVIVGTQKRLNFKYNDVEIAVKWSEDWKYHVEFEIVVASPEDKAAADIKIIETARLLSVQLMTEQEVLDFSAKVRSSKK